MIAFWKFPDEGRAAGLGGGFPTWKCHIFVIGRASGGGGGILHKEDTLDHGRYGIFETCFRFLGLFWASARVRRGMRARCVLVLGGYDVYWSFRVAPLLGRLKGRWPLHQR